jgi:hypothetical protein
MFYVKHSDLMEKEKSFREMLTKIIIPPLISPMNHLKTTIKAEISIITLEFMSL